MYNLVNELLSLVKTYESTAVDPQDNIYSFRKWIESSAKNNETNINPEPEWNGKVNGRTADSVINTLLVHLYRYAKIHAKAAIEDSQFSTSDEFIYLICLTSGGAMSKSALIRENIHDKPAGSLIIKRLLDKGFISQESSGIDKRSVMINITDKGSAELSKSMSKIRLASSRVTGPLLPEEKMQLITLLQKLEDFHYGQNFEKI